MEIALPHTLGREEARRRLHAKAGELTGALPGGIAEARHVWRDDYNLDMTITAMGATLNGTIAIADKAVVLSLDLPASLGFVRNLIEGPLREKGQKLLAP